MPFSYIRYHVTHRSWYLGVWQTHTKKSANLHKEHTADFKQMWFDNVTHIKGLSHTADFVVMLSNNNPLICLNRRMYSLHIERLYIIIVDIGFLNGDARFCTRHGDFITLHPVNPIGYIFSI
jgi:hypothetical protein